MTLPKFRHCAVREKLINFPILPKLESVCYTWYNNEIKQITARKYEFNFWKIKSPPYWIFHYARVKSSLLVFWQSFAYAIYGGTSFKEFRVDHWHLSLWNKKRWRHFWKKSVLSLISSKSVNATTAWQRRASKTLLTCTAAQSVNKIFV